MAIVHRVLGDCPGCGGKACFGNIMIDGTVLRRGCGRCNYRSRVILPDVQKRIIYLDQSLLSSAFKGRDEKAVRAVNRVSELASKQMLVAPYSNVHEDETYQWAGYGGKTAAELMQFIEATARGLDFNSTYDIEHTQAYKAFKAFLEGGPSKYQLEVSDAVEGDIHEWHDYVYISVGRYLGDPAEISRLKQEAVQTLVGVFDDWAQSKNNFMQDVALEIADAGRNYINEYIKYVARIGGGDFNALLDSPVASQCVQSLLQAVPKGTPPDEAIRKVASFFASPHFANLPSEWLSARIFATLKAMVRRGEFANRTKALETHGGVFFDVQHIATYAPYSDAIFIDNQMANLVKQPTVGITDRFGTQVFSRSTMDEFLSWLDNVESSMTQEHEEALRRAYGTML